jgi:adenylate cyclase
MIIIVGLVSILASLFSTWQTYDQYNRIGIKSFLNGIVDGFIISFSIGFYSLFITEIFFKNFFSRFNFISLLLINSTAYVSIVIIGRALGRYLMETNRFILFPIYDPIQKLHFFQTLAFAFAISFLINFIIQNNRLLGPSALKNFILGKYHNPKKEKRIILFMDLVSSTTLAEKLGDERFIQFLDKTFSLLTEAILKTEAEIYKYVGDEIIFSWKIERGIKNANCVELFYLINHVIQSNREIFENQFGTIPKFRAGLHMGSVAVGKIGDIKQEIALIGDVMNTTSRIMNECKNFNLDIILSEELFTILKLPSKYKPVPLGNVLLKGKLAPLELVGLS